MRIAVAAVIASACSNETMVSLHGFAPGELRARVSADGSSLTAELVLLTSNDCAVLSGHVVATLDGAPLDLVTRGAYEPPAASDAASSCKNPTFQGTPDPAATSTLSISDGTTTIAAAFASLGVPRTFTVDSLQRGTTARFTWSVATDTVGNLEGAPLTPLVAWMPDQGSGFGIGGDTPAPAGPSVDGTAVLAPIPADAATGTGTFYFDMLFGPTITSCTGIARCDAEPPDPPGLRATIAP